MSILIKGMEMPNDGRPRKALFTLKDGVPVVIVETAKSYDDKHIDVHPLVPVPPHGRLIDADALYKSYGASGNCNKCDLDAYKCQYYNEHTMMEFCALIDDAPTIIEAEDSFFNSLKRGLEQAINGDVRETTIIESEGDG